MTRASGDESCVRGVSQCSTRPFAFLGGSERLFDATILNVLSSLHYEKGSFYVPKVLETIAHVCSRLPKKRLPRVLEDLFYQESMRYSRFEDVFLSRRVPR